APPRDLHSFPTRRSSDLGAALLMAPLLLFLVLAYAWPFLGVVKWSFTLPTPGLGQYHALLTDQLVQSVFIRTLRIAAIVTVVSRSEEHTSELQSRSDLVC